MIKIFKDNKIDMLNGSLVDKLIIFAIPLMLTGMLQQMFNAADIIVCGRFVGPVALAAVGANAQTIHLFINIFIGLSIGTNVIIANYIGAEKREKIHNVVHTAMTFAFAFGFLLMLIVMYFAKSIHVFLGTPDDLIDKAVLYLRIVLIGIPFIVIYNFGAAILRSVGDTKRPLIILTLAGLLNAILNVILVVCFNLGISGVAIATTTSNILSSITVIILLVREKGDIHYHFGKWMLDLHALSRIMKIGIPSSLQSMVFSISNMCVQSAVNSLGTNTIAANTAAINFEMFGYYAYTSFSSACVTFMSQNFGAEKFDRCKKVMKYCILLGTIFSGVFTIVLEIFADKIITIFTVEKEVIDIAMVRIRLVGTVAWIQVLSECMASGLRALKHPVLPTIMVILGTVIFRIIWCLTVFPIYHTYFMLVIVYPLSWIIIDTAMFITYNKISKKVLKIDLKA